ncbi:MAG: efflux RND transporter permease subunit [Acidobacteriota bacterium]
MPKGVIAWFASNGVAANLLMIVIAALGFMAIPTNVMEVFPEISTETITISVPYLGAAPEEVENGVCVRVEEAIQDIEGIKKLRSTASEGAGTVVVELETDADGRKVLDEVKSRVDAITTFPDETEKPIIQEVLIRSRVITVAIFGDIGERSLKLMGEQVRDDLSALPEITQVDLTAVRPYEISIEVTENDLRRYGLTFDEVSRAVRNSSLDLPGGAVKSTDGEILLRTQGQAYRAAEFEELVLRANPDGTRLLLGDVATVIDGFAETDEASRFDGEPAVLVQIYRVGKQSAITIADAAKDYTEELQAALPDGVHVTTWQDDTLILKDRLRVLLDNGRIGLLLVLLVLALFLKIRLAIWVAVGIAVSFMGAVALMPYFDVSVNVMSLFAFILVLGIVVADAIVVGENIYRHFEKGKSGYQAAVDGARQVAVPVTFSILTTVAAFSPLVGIPGPSGQIMRVIPIIVVSCLAFSLIESLLIMPNHLSHMSHRKEAARQPGPIARGWDAFQGRFVAGMAWVVDRFYRPLLDFTVQWRYATMAAALSLLMLVGGAVAAGWIKFEFFPAVEADNAVALVTMPQGSTPQKTAEALRQIEEAAQELERQLADEGHSGAFRHVLSTIGGHPFVEMNAQRGPAAGNVSAAASSAHLGEVNIELAGSEFRDIASGEIANRWRDITGPIPDTVELSFSANMMSFGKPIDVQLASSSLDQLRAAAALLKERLRDYPGISDIADSYREGKREIKLDVEPRAEALGLNLDGLARQVRQGFYGAEAQRIQRGRDDVRVMVRYSAEERANLASLENMRIRTPSGAEVPFSFAGRAEMGRGYAAIQRTDRRRTMNVTAEVDPAVATGNEVVADLETNVLPEIVNSFPGVTYSLAGEQETQRESLQGLGRAFVLALLMIYALLAIPFRSYLQPAIVMSAIPFGLVGAVLGHAAIGMSLTMLSLFGVIALTGVVVNDSLVMVDFINRRVRGGAPIDEAIRDAGAARFRPIVLTSVTTFVGLTPLLLERGLQAQFLIPMATSLAFGVLFATVITLVLVPVLYRILEDVTGAESKRQKAAAAPVATGNEALQPAAMS